MGWLLQDLRYAVRKFVREPGFTVVAVLTLGLGIGATVAIFSVVNGVLLRPLPYPDPDRLTRVWQVNDEGRHGIWSDQNLADVREQSSSFSGMAEYAGTFFTVLGAGEAERVAGAMVGADFVPVLRVAPALGRTFTADESADAAPVALIGHAYWRTRFGGSAGALGAVISVNGAPHTIIGVMPEGFDYPGGAQLWTPRPPRPGVTRTGHAWHVVARLRDGVSLERASQDVSGVARRIKQQYGDDTWMVDAAVVPLHDEIVGRVRPALLLLLGAAGLLMLIACANVSSLLLARATARQREIAVRRALGAGRARLAKQFLTEAVVLSGAGGALGLLLAAWAVGGLLALDPARLPRNDAVGLDWHVAAFALAMAAAAAAAIALITTLRGGVVDAREALAQSQRTVAGGVAGRARAALAAAQVAFTVLLLVGAGLLGRSFLRVLDVDAGYRTEGAVVLGLSLPWSSSDADAVRLGQFHERLLAGLRAIPGVAEVGGVDAFPLSGGGADGMFAIVTGIEGEPTMEALRELARDPNRTGYAEYRIATAGYFRAMRIPLLRGRLFDERDDASAPHVAVISESLARMRWPNEDPIGQRIQYGNMDGDMRPIAIVGVVGDVRESSMETEPEPTFYANARQRTASLGGPYSVVLEGPAEAAQVTAAARRLVRELDPTIPLRFRTLDEIFSASLADRRFSLVLLGLFGATALLLATMGIYGVVAYLVVQRTREIGLRMALGARPGGVLRMVLHQGLLFAGVGIAAGVVGAVALTRVMGGFLYGVGTTDPLTLAAVSMFLAAVSLGASYIPARRATAVDPMQALRNE